MLERLPLEYFGYLELQAIILFIPSPNLCFYHMNMSNILLNGNARAQMFVYFLDFFFLNLLFDLMDANSWLLLYEYVKILLNGNARAQMSVCFQDFVPSPFFLI